MTIRDELNQQDPNRSASALSEAALGEALNLLIRSATPTETGVVPSSDVATLAAQPKTLYDINATTAAVTGRKKLILAPISGAGSVLPKTGEAVFDGGTKVLFNVADAVTAASFTYTTAAGATISLLQRDLDGLGQ